MQTTEPVTEYFGHLKVITWTDAEGISINVFTANTRNSTLSACYPHAEREAAKTWYRTIRDSALAGNQVWLIEAQVSALIDAGRVVDQAEQELIDGVNANIDRMTAAQPSAVDVSDILDERGPSFADLKRDARRDFTRTRVSSKPPTPAELERIRAHRDGIVTLLPGQPWPLLQAIVDRGLGEVHEYRIRQIPRSVKLNARGWALVESEMAA